MAPPPQDIRNTLHPEMREHLDKYPLPDFTAGIPDASIRTKRVNRALHLDRLRHLYVIPGPIPEQVYEVKHDIQIDGHVIPVKIYAPIPKRKEGSPVIVMLHEGGWCMGDLSDEDQNCRLFCRDLGAVCVNVDYPLAPEHKFPQGLLAVERVVKWVRLTASPDSGILPGDLRKGFIIGGTSAGGNLAAVVCQAYRDHDFMPPITGQYLCVPALLWPDFVPGKWSSEYRSQFESKFDPVFTLNEKDASDLLMMLKPARLSHRFNPLFHENLRELPPAFFQIAGLDPLRDEGLLYERLLREENNTPTLLNVYEGFGHMFWTNWPTMQRSREFVQDTVKGVAWLLEIHKAEATGNRD